MSSSNEEAVELTLAASGRGTPLSMQGALRPSPSVNSLGHGT